MSDALREQLLKAGLATEQDVKRARTQKRHQDRNHRKQGKGRARPQSETAQQTADAQAQKRARDRTLNQRREAEKRRKADEHAARELVIKHEIAHGRDGDLAFNFMHDGRIKKIYVSREQQQQLAEGKIAIARTRGRFRLIPRDIAERVRPRAPFLVAFLSEGDSAADDPAYADHPVPDDLIW
jgi:uncharacterized protein YaiL (DUF2058 family)